MKIPETCLECDEGRYEVVVKAYESGGQDHNVVVVPNVKFLRCSHCGEELMPAESVRYISRFVAEMNEQLPEAKLYSMLERSGLSQKDFAEAVGLGEKTFHRWLKGTQVVSRSMGYYLRVLEQFPEVFLWVKERSWRQSTLEVSPPRDTSGSSPFTALVKRGGSCRSRSLVKIRTNPATTLVLEAVHRDLYPR